MTIELPEPLDVLAVGAHPDDVEIGCGGTLARLVEQGYRVGIVDLTDGEPTPLSPHKSVRMEEARLAGEALGIHVRENLGLPNRTLFDGFGPRVALARCIRTHRPKVVIGIAGKTPLASPDHWQTMQITDAAVFYARLSKWDDEFGDLPVHLVHRQFWYPLVFQSLDIPDGGGRFVVDISSTLEKKIAAVRAYVTQFPPTKERIYRMVEGQARMWGSTAGYEAGELLIAATMLGTQDLMASFVP